MHGREGEERKRRRHMWPVPAPGTAAAPPQLPAATSASPVTLPPPSITSESTPESDSLPSTCDFFLKDGRKIQVGDCALFQSGNAPPFIGLIRCIVFNKEENIKLCVNWLYRPADIKLAKGLSIEAAPNEVFYSFHKDDIPAASLLHPCKVAFLRKGIELPVGISSFVCRRVYDIANKCLWWLTDQDYINERQEEVDQLLDKTRQEMHAAVQSGGRSPKPLNGSANTQQLKSGSESAQNTANSFPSQSKKKRERIDQGADPIKRERSAKPDDGDSVNVKLEIMIKAEIAKITEKGGLVSTEGVEKLVNLMQLDRSERKIDVTGRILVAEVIAATDRYDCLGRFVQLRGVAIFDDWLQEAHKGKSGDGSPKECDKIVEDLLLSLLRALDKLPVNLNALQACNIGKSVNHLRSHKNLEIQKKARSLIDTWKKRVDAEMTKINDAKSMGSSQPAAWPAKSGFSDVSLGGNKRPGSVEIAAKSPVHQPAACKSVPGKTGHSDAVVKSAPVASGSGKAALTLPTSVSVSSNAAKLVLNSGGSEIPTSAVKEEKSSSSSQSQNNSQSCSGDHIKAIGSSKEDTRSSTSGSVSKATGGSSRHRRSNNGVLAMGVSGTQKDNTLVKSSSPNRHAPSEKTSQSGLTCEKPVDMSTADNGNNHGLIVRLTNLGRSPARNSTGGSFEDPSAVGSRASSPGVPDKHEHGDRRMKLRSDTSRSHISGDANTGSWQNSDDKDAGGAEEGTRSPVANLDEEHSRNAEDIVKDATRTTCSSSGHEKGVIVTETRNRNSFSSINALIESFAKCSETSAPLSAGDDMGMNLLASVAAGEMSKSESPTGSAGTSTPIDDPSTGNNEAKPRFSCDDDVAQGHSTSDEAADADSEKVNGADPMETKDEHQLEVTDIPCNTKAIILVQDTKPDFPPISAMNFLTTTDSSTKTDVKHEEERSDGRSLSKTLQVNDERVGVETSLHEDKKLTAAQVLDDYTDTKLKERNSSLDESKSVECAHERIEGNVCTSDTGNKDLDVTACKKIEVSISASISKESTGVSTSTDKLEPMVTEVTEKSNVDNAHSGEQDTEGSRGCNTKNLGDGPPETFSDEKHDVLASSALYESVKPTVVSTSNAGVKDVKIKESHEGRTTGPAVQESSAEDSARHAKLMASGLSEVSAEEQAAPSAKTPKLSVTGEADIVMKLDFDLNEGIMLDDGTQVEPAILMSTNSTSATHLSGISFANPRPNGLPAPITVASAKGSFVPPENLMKSKGEPGWKGSAATSAFRPAEPRKVLEMPLSTPDLPPDSTGKQGRPPLDIDLNIADERDFDDMATQSSDQTGVSESKVDAPSRPAVGFDLDLNRVDENPENGQFLASTSHRLEVPLMPVKPASGVITNGEANVLRDFDLNDGPSIDEIPTETVQRSQNSKSSSGVPFVPQVPGLRINNADLGSVSSWFPMGNSYSAVAIQSLLPDRAEQQPYPIVAAPGAQRILGSVSGGGTFTTDIYRGPVLSSSPAMAFSPATAFPYAGFPFGSSFPLASTFSGGNTTYSDSASAGGSGYPSIPSQLVGPAGAVPSHYQRQYVINIPEGSTSVGSDNSRRWSRQGLDLNAGPGSSIIEGKDERLPAASRSLSVATSQAFMDEQSRTYGLPSGSLKRKEPEGGWDADRSVYKQPSWQ